MLGFELCKLSLHFMDDTLCDNCFASSWPALLFIRSPLCPAHLSSPASAQTHSWHGSRMLVLHREDCSNSQKSSVSNLVVAWLETIRSWWMALPKFTWGTAEPCPGLQGEEPLAGALEQCCIKCITSHISTSASLNSGLCPTSWQHFCLQHWGQGNPVMVSGDEYPLWVTQQMIPHAFTKGGNGDTTKVPRSGLVTICIAGGAAASFSGWGSQMNGTCTCF